MALLCSMISTGCARREPVASEGEARRTAPPPPRMPSASELRANALALGAGDCGDLKRIRHLVPKAGQLGQDPYYDRIYVHPVEYRSCLIERIPDATSIPAVHGGPGLQITNVGDMAYHMLDDMHLVPPNDCTPTDVRKDMETQGAFAFHHWRDDPANRRAWANCIQRHFAAQRQDIAP